MQRKSGIFFLIISVSYRRYKFTMKNIVCSFDNYVYVILKRAEPINRLYLILHNAVNNCLFTWIGKYNYKGRRSRVNAVIKSYNVHSAGSKSDANKDWGQTYVHPSVPRMSRSPGSLQAYPGWARRQSDPGLRNIGSYRYTRSLK